MLLLRVMSSRVVDWQLSDWMLAVQMLVDILMCVQQVCYDLNALISES